MILEKQPKDLIVIGAGAIGVEFAYFYSTLGTKVTIVEMLQHLLPIEDEEVSITLEKNFKKRGIDILTSAMVEKAEVKGNKVNVMVNVNGEKKIISAERVLNAIGVIGNVEGIGLEELGVHTENNNIKVNKETYETNVKDIFAIGDVIGPSMAGSCCLSRRNSLCRT